MLGAFPPGGKCDPLSLPFPGAPEAAPAPSFITCSLGRKGDTEA